jgi:hypothetical protein
MKYFTLLWINYTSLQQEIIGRFSFIRFLPLMTGNLSSDSTTECDPTSWTVKRSKVRGAELIIKFEYSYFQYDEPGSEQDWNWLTDKLMKNYLTLNFLFFVPSNQINYGKLALLNLFILEFKLCKILPSNFDSIWPWSFIHIEGRSSTILI